MWTRRSSFFSNPVAETTGLHLHERIVCQHLEGFSEDVRALQGWHTISKRTSGGTLKHKQIVEGIKTEARTKLKPKAKEIVVQQLLESSSWGAYRAILSASLVEMHPRCRS